MQDFKEILGKRRDRTIAILLSYKEKEIDRFLPEDLSVAFRKTLLDHINDLCEFAFDLEGSSGITEFNEVYIERLEDIYDKIHELYEGVGLRT